MARGNKIRIEYEDESGDPWGYSYTGWRSFSIPPCSYDEESQPDEETKPSTSHTERTGSDDTDEESDMEAFQDEPLVEESQGRLQDCIMICFICLFLACLNFGLGVGMLYVGKSISSREEVDLGTRYPTMVPTIFPSTTSLVDFSSTEEDTSLNTTCHICGLEEYIISKPDTIPFVQNVLDLPETTTCSGLDYSGRIAGSISPDDCDSLKSQTQIFKQCGCKYSSKKSVGDDDLSVVGEVLEPTFPGCSMCGSNLMNNPLATVSISVPWGYLENTVCENLNAVGLTGYISPQACFDIQSNKQIIETCCLARTNTDSTQKDSESVPFPKCFLCGSETGELSNPDSILSLPSFPGYLQNTTCAHLNKIGMEGKISPENCSILLSQTEEIEQCGCSNFFNV